MNNYYSNKLKAEKLKRVYEIAPPRVKQYFEAEINFVANKIHSNDLVLELGCGYGRIFPSLSISCSKIIGIDTSLLSMQMGKEMLGSIKNCLFTQMNAVQLAFPSYTFDVVVCIQNGISAFHVNQKDLILESLRVTKPNGTLLFSSYSEKFWNHRLEWFQLQAEEGLIGEIDFEKTTNGNIICKDGFSATTFGFEQFDTLVQNLDKASASMQEVDESSIFCEIKKAAK